MIFTYIRSQKDTVWQSARPGLRTNNLNVKGALVVVGADSDNVVLSARNIPTVKTAYVNTINVYDILKYNTVVATKAAVANIEEVYA